MSKKRLLFVVWGGTFRANKFKMYGRKTVLTDFEIESQIICCDSHIKLIQHIKEKFNVEVDVKLVMRRANDFCNEILHKKYTPKHVVYVDSQINAQKEWKFAQHFNPIDRLFHIFHTNALLDNEGYDYIFATRFDVAFKHKFFQTFKLSESKIVFTYPKATNGIIKLNERVNGKRLIDDHTFLIPKMYFNILKHCEDVNIPFIINHHTITAWRNCNFNFQYDFFEYIEWRCSPTLWNSLWYSPHIYNASNILTIENFNGVDYSASKRVIGDLEVREGIILTKKEIIDYDKDLILPKKVFTQQELQEIWCNIKDDHFSYKSKNIPLVVEDLLNIIRNNTSEVFEKIKTLLPEINSFNVNVYFKVKIVFNWCYKHNIPLLTFYNGNESKYKRIGTQERTYINAVGEQVLPSKQCFKYLNFKSERFFYVVQNMPEKVMNLNTEISHKVIEDNNIKVLSQYTNFYKDDKSVIRCVEHGFIK